MMRLAATFAATVAACIVATWSPPAQALALGEIDLQSRLNEPLTARIPLRLSAGDNVQSLRVSVADPEDFERSGLQYDDYLLSVDLMLAPASGAEPAYVLVSSGEIAREPFIDLMIEAKAGGSRVLRNYTILLDPPVLAAAPTATPAAPAATPAPAQAVPVPSDSPSASYDVAPQPVTPPVGQDETTGLPSVSSTDPGYFKSGSGWVEGGTPAASDSDTAALKIAEAAPASSSKRYGPVDRKETLWSIAYALRPDPSITMDQMQLAIFRANPQAFDGNINRMLSGVTLDIPSAAQIRAVDPASAKAEVARQRSSYVPPAAVSRPAQAAPESYDDAADDLAAVDSAYDDFDTNVDEPASDDDYADSLADDDDLGGGLDDDLAEADSFDDGFESAPVEDSTAETEPEGGFEDAPAETGNSSAEATPADRPLTALERLRAGRSGGATAPTSALQPATPAEAEPVAVVEADPTTSDDALAAGSAAGSDSEPAASDTPAPQPAAPAATTPAPAAPIAAADSDSGGGLPWALIGGLGALVLAALAFFGVRRRRAAATVDAAPMAAPIADDDETEQPEDEAFPASDTAVLDESEYGLGEQSEPKPRQDVAPDVPVIDEPDGLSETAIMDAGEDATADTGKPDTPDDAGEDAMAATMQFDANTISLDLSGDDPISEADVHLAYGATDEAQSVMETAVQAAPDNAAYRNKLAEVYFTANAADKFVAHARDSESVLKAGSGDGWQKLLILGQQIAPDEPLFAQADAAELQSADFDFGSEPDPLDDADGGEPAGLDIADPTPDVGDAAATDANNASDDDGGLEFDLGDLDVATEEPAEAISEEPAQPAAAEDDNSLEFDLGDLDLGEEAGDADSTPEPVSAETTDGDDGSLEFDLGDLDLGEDDATPAPAVGADSGDAESPAEFDLGDLDLGEGDDDDAMGALGDFDLGDEPVAEADDAGAAVDAAGLDALLGDSDGTADVPGQSDDDVATKLDLARAYVDMGDKDLAESLLKDVAEAGDDAQQAEASELMSKLAGA